LNSPPARAASCKSFGYYTDGRPTGRSLATARKANWDRRPVHSLRPLPRWWDRQARRIRSRPCRPSRSSQPIGSSHPCLAKRRMTSAKMAGNSCFSRSITSLGVALRSDVTLTPFPRACMRRGIIGQMRGRKVRTAVMADPGNARRWQAGLRRMCPPMHAGVLRNLFIHLPMAKAARSPTACDIYDLKARHAAPTIVLVRWERHHTFFDS
jgi:hypothetical protein